MGPHKNSPVILELSLEYFNINDLIYAYCVRRLAYSCVWREARSRLSIVACSLPIGVACSRPATGMSVRELRHVIYLELAPMVCSKVIDAEKALGIQHAIACEVTVRFCAPSF